MAPKTRTDGARARLLPGLGLALLLVAGCPTHTDVMGEEDGEDDFVWPWEEEPQDEPEPDGGLDANSSPDGPVDAVEPLPSTLHIEVYLVPVYYERLEDDVFARMELEWTEVDPAGYPYGILYVALTEELGATTSPLTYALLDAVPSDPKNDPAELDLQVEELAGRTVYVAAVADRWADGVVSPRDALAFDPRPVEIQAHGEADAVVFVDVDLDWDWESGRWVASEYCRSAVLPGCIVEADLEGEIRLQDSQVSVGLAPSIVGLYTADGAIGPMEATLPGELDGEVPEQPLPWALHIRVPPCGAGGFGLFGAWDSNGNGMIEPDDEWGTLWTGDGGFDPTLIVSHGDWLTGLDIRLPWDGAVPPFGRPYQHIAGTIGTDETFSFADLEPTDTLHVMALREPASHLPGCVLADHAVTQGFAWDHRSFPATELGDGPIPFELRVPWDAYVHVFAGVEADDNGGISDEYELEEPDRALDLCSHAVPEDLALVLGRAD